MSEDPARAEADTRPLLPARRPATRAVAIGTAASVLLVAAFFLIPVSVASSSAPLVNDLSSSPSLVNDADKLPSAKYGSCAAQPSVFSNPLRWGDHPDYYSGSAKKTADYICCNNERYAEVSGYFKQSTLPSTLPPGASTITFYDTATGAPLFIAPKGRTYEAFYEESIRHGWPSFRDAEVIWDNVEVKGGGETVSKTGTHLGHNLPDYTGNRYCINILCVAGPEQTGSGLVKSITT